MILVTGATGFVGSHLLLYLLRKDYKVRALYRHESAIAKTRHLFKLYHPNPNELFDKIQWIKGDITDITTLENIFSEITKVYHTAAVVNFDKNSKDLMLNTNVEGTKNILQFSIDNNVEKFIHVSSTAALGGYDNPITEKTHWTWKEKSSAYGKSKYLSEMEVWRATQEGLDAVIVNPSIILGAGFWNEGTGQIFSKVNEGLKYYTDGVKGCVDVWDVVKAMVLLMESDIVNESFIVSAENISFKELLDKISIALKKNPPKTQLKSWIKPPIKFLNFISDMIGTKPIVSTDMLESLFTKHYCSSEKLVKNLDFKFIPLDLSINNIAEKFLLENP